jgi:replicative DNA helicase
MGDIERLMSPADWQPDDRSRPRSAASPMAGGRVPPHNLDAEESLLGAMLLSKDAIAVATEKVTSAEFYKPAHAHIFDAIVSLNVAGEPADVVTVAEELNRCGVLDVVGGASTLVSLQTRVPATTNASRYATIVEELALLRRLIGVAGEIADLSYDVPDDVTKAVDHAETLVFEVSQRRVTDTMQSIYQLLDASLDRLEQSYERGQAITGLPTGFTDLDDCLSGLQPSSLYIIGARPSAGKTALGLCMATHAALESNRPVLLFALEMSRLELTQRMLCAEARVDSKRIRNGKLQADDWQRIAAATGRLAEADVWIDDNPNLTIMEIRSKARRLKSRVGDLGLVVVDYLQLMTGRTSAENRQVEVSEISRGLKILARELECPVVALSQLSRQLELRADKRPMLADLRESGCLTADTRITRADTGQEVTLGELLRRDERNVPIWTLNERYKLVRGELTHVFPSGIKTVYELRLKSGRSVQASGNHPFLALEGWYPLDELDVGDRIAVPRGGPWDDTVGTDPVGDDTVPRELWNYVRKEAPNHGLSLPDIERRLEMTDFVERFYADELTRDQLGRLATVVPDPVLGDLARSDVVWDTIVGIDELGEAEVYDATVRGTHNFVAQGIVVHNSIEQDADVVMFIYRDDVYNPDSPDRGTAEVIVAKHRNGPTATVRLAFLEQYTKFANMARGV